MPKSAAIERRVLPVGAVVVALVVLLSWPAAVGAQSAEGDDPLRTVTVGGLGQADVEPDQAVVRVGVTTRGGSAKATSRRSSSRMSSVLEALRDLGVDAADLKTTKIEMRPYRQRDRNGEVTETGWVVSNQVKVTVRDIAQTGDVIDAAVAAGANDLKGVNFRASDPSTARSEARAAAVVAAEAAASELAEAAGVEVLGVLSIVEGGVARSGIQLASSAAESAIFAASTPIEPGTIDIRVSVTIVYEVG